MVSTHKTRYTFFILTFLAICTIALSSCDDELFTTDPNCTLEFSTDTLTFDTVFTTIGSTTSQIMVYNRNNRALNISHIGLAGGEKSEFRINVDGSTNENNQFENIEISANDSMFIFVEITVDPTNSGSPVLIEESLNFLTNGVKQDIKLMAYGQDMEILRGKRILNDTTLTAVKPYLVYDSLIVSQAKTLTLNPGCKLYFHNNANLIVYGNLRALGTAEKPISMRGDRLDKIKFDTPFPYNNVSGQWGGVYLLWNEGNHTFRHVNMNSGYVGIYLPNKEWSSLPLPNLEISNCRIHNFLLYGLMVENADVTVTNTEISNSSSYCVYLNGGKHTFIHSTIANYFNNSNVQPTARDKEPAVMILNINRSAPMESIFRNCIITGSQDNEFSLATRYEEQYNGTFDHSYIRKPKALETSQFSNIRWYAKNDTVFKNTYYDYKKNTYFDFTPDSVSPARGLADSKITLDANLQLDLNGNNRLEDGKPDAGAYEWKPTK